jgi:DNA-binding transcriptional regulator YiaG
MTPCKLQPVLSEPLRGPRHGPITLARPHPPRLQHQEPRTPHHPRPPRPTLRLSRRHPQRPQVPPVLVGGMPDHVHLLFVLARTLSLSEIVEELKKESSRWAKTSEYDSLRQELRSTRVNAGLSQRDLAVRLKVPHSWIAKVESGERRIDMVEFCWFVMACGLDPRPVCERLLRRILAREQRGRVNGGRSR